MLFKLFQRYILEVPAKVDMKNQHVFIIISVCHFFGIVTHTSWILLFWLLGVKPLAFFNFISVSTWMLSYYINRKGFHLSATTLGTLEVYLHQTLCVYYIGWKAGFQYYILIIPVFIYLLPRGKNFEKFILTIIGFLNYLVLHHLFENTEPIYILNMSIINFFYYSNTTIFILLVCICCHFFSTQIFTAQNALRKEQGKVAEAYNLISKYVAPQLAHKISTGQIDSIWKHSRQKLTMFFSDIKNFTQLTDALEPEDMAAILNEYLSEMNEIINKYQGTLAQVIGDGLYVFFGAPEKTDDEDHAMRCLKMAIDMQLKMKELNKKWYKIGIEEELKIRCGINTGMATVGGYGSSDRKEYTAMGMQVNIAARIESACEPGRITLNHSTYVLVKDHFSFINKGEIKAKGYHRPLKIYEVELDKTSI